MACALPWHLVKGLSHLTCCTFRCRSVFHFFNRKLFTYFYIIWFSWPVFKTKRIFWKMANKFFRTSIPSSVPLWHRVWKEESSVQCLTPYSLLTVDSAGTASGGRGRSGYQAQWSQLLRGRLLSSGTWCHQRTGLLLLVSGMVDLCGPGPHIAGGWHAPVSPGDEPCLPQPGFGPLSAHTASLLLIGLAFPSHRPLGEGTLGCCLWGRT